LGGSGSSAVIGINAAIAQSPAFAGWFGKVLSPTLASALIGSLTVAETHFADWELRDSQGQFKGQGEEVSGSDDPAPGQLDWPEQLRTHTEYKILDEVYRLGKIAPGNVLKIEGIDAPCYSCFRYMEGFAKANRIWIFYYGGGKIHVFPPF
jgi:hypothetical protein